MEYTVMQYLLDRANITDTITRMVSKYLRVLRNTPACRDHWITGTNDYVECIHRPA